MNWTCVLDVAAW